MVTLYVGLVALATVMSVVWLPLAVGVAGVAAVLVFRAELLWLLGRAANIRLPRTAASEKAASQVEIA